MIFRDIRFVSRYHSDPWWGRGEAISFTAIPRSPQTQVGQIHDIRSEIAALAQETGVPIDD